jgi:hypothetical protein
VKSEKKKNKQKDVRKMKGALNPKRGNLSSTESVHRVKKKEKKKKKYFPKRLLFMVNKIFLGKAIFFLMS